MNYKLHNLTTDYIECIHCFSKFSISSVVKYTFCNCKQSKIINSRSKTMGLINGFSATLDTTKIFWEDYIVDNFHIRSYGDFISIFKFELISIKDNISDVKYIDINTFKIKKSLLKMNKEQILLFAKNISKFTALL